MRSYLKVNSVTVLFKGLLCCFFGLLFSFSSYAKDIICKHCSYKNDSTNRYCLNCVSLLREMNLDERKNRDRLKKRQQTKSYTPLKPYSSQSNPVVKDKKKVKTIVFKGERKSIEKHAIKGGITIFDFYADWCGPCRQIDPMLKKFVKKNKGFYLRKINIVKWGSPIAKKYKINSIPSLWIMGKNGQWIKKRGNYNDVKKLV